MKKNNQSINIPVQNESSAKYLPSENIKTTNVNILLNRVRLDRKKTIRKRIILFLTLVCLISTLAVYLTI